MPGQPAGRVQVNPGRKRGRPAADVAPSSNCRPASDLQARRAIIGGNLSFQHSNVIPSARSSDLYGILRLATSRGHTMPEGHPV